MAQAQAWLDAHLHPEAVAVSPAAVTVRDWTGLWHATYVQPISAPGTARHHLYLLRMLTPAYAVPLPDLRVSQLQAIVGQIAGRVSAATVHMAVGVWRRCLEAAVDDEMIARNPARRLVLPKAPPRPVRRHLTPREVAILREAIAGHRFEAAYALLLGCGLRIGEVLGLHWRDVDMAGHRIWVQHQWTGSAWRNLPKGRNPHWVRMPSLVEAALIRHRDRQPPGSVLVMQSPFRHKGRDVQPWSVYAVRGDLRDLVTAAGLEHLTPHAARHGLASMLLDGGASPAEIADRLGHSDASVTMRSYVHGSSDGRARADALIDAYLGTPPGTDREIRVTQQGDGPTRPSESEPDSAN